MEADDKLSNEPSMHVVERNAVIYALQMPSREALSPDRQQMDTDEGGGQAGVDERDDAFYELTPRDVAIMQRDLTEKMNRQLALMPTRFVEEKNSELKQQAWKHGTIRFKLPNSHIIQAQFFSYEPVSELFKFVRDIFDVDDRFELRLAREKLAKDDTRSLINADLAPKSLLVLRFLDDVEDLMPNTPLTKCSEEEANRISDSWLSVNSSYQPYMNSEKISKVLNKQKQEEHRADPSDEYRPSASLQRQKENEGQLPKWLKRKL